MSPPAIGDDIPIAQRTRQLPRTRTPWQRLKWVLVGGSITLAALALLLRGPLNGLITPLPVPGLDARIESDGRLLGHFPYPQASPRDLVSVDSGMKLQPAAASALQAMRQAAAAQGVQLVLLSAYRDEQLQKELFFDVMSQRNQNAVDRARVSAPPGFSEHSTGFAIDLGDGREPATHLSTSFEATRAYRWLEAHAARYHFRLSFPRDNGQGVSYEPWHWRYEGSTEALRLFEPAQRLSREPQS